MRNELTAFWSAGLAFFENHAAEPCGQRTIPGESFMISFWTAASIAALCGWGRDERANA